MKTPTLPGILCLLVPLATAATPAPAVPPGTSLTRAIDLKTDEAAYKAYTAGDFATAMTLFRQSAVSGDPYAQTYIGNMYHDGEGVSRDDAEAAKWYRLAATDPRSTDAQNALATLYHTGRGVPRDDVEAVKWLRLAADSGHARAQNNLGTRYEHGEGVPRDDTEAAKYYRQSADQGDIVAARNLGVCYLFGRGVTGDDAEAEKWFLKAASRGDGRAMLRLSFLNIGQSNPGSATAWMFRSARAGDPVALGVIGIPAAVVAGLCFWRRRKRVARRARPSGGDGSTPAVCRG